MSATVKLSARDREDAKQAAQRILDAAGAAASNPSSALIGQAAQLGVPIETLVLWFAQLVLEAP